MIQAKLSLSESHVYFLQHYKDYGFKDKSALVREALTHFQRNIEKESLLTSADLYAEVYEEDEDVRELTEAALAEWTAIARCENSW